MLKTKKVLSIIFAITLVCMSLGGCKAKDTAKDAETSTVAPTEAAVATDAPEATDTEVTDLSSIIPTETVTLDVYDQLANYSGEQIGWFAKIMKDKFNVVLNIIPTGDGVFATRMESGKLGDIVIFGNDGDEYKQAIAGEMLLDWNEDSMLQTYGSYINESMQTPLKKNAGLSPDGTVYGFGHDVGTSTTEHAAFFYHPDVRWDLYAQLGYPAIPTLEDYVGVLEKMVALQPTSDSGAKTYAMSIFSDWDGDMVTFVKSLGALYGYDELGLSLYNVNTQTAEPILDDNSMYLRSLNFYHQLYMKGLLDPDSMTQTSDDAIDAYQDGAAIFNIFTFLGRDFYNTDTHTAAGKGMYALASDDMKSLAYGLNIYGSNRIWSIGADTEYPELCMAIINWLSTPEGMITSWNGPKGTNWDYDAEGYAYLTELGAACRSDATTPMTGDYSGTFEDGNFKMNNTTWAMDSVNPEGNGETFNYLFWKNTLSKPTTVAEQAWKDKTGFLCADDYLEDGHISISIGTDFTTSVKSDEFSTTWNQVRDCIRTATWNAIYAKDDAEFNEIIAQAKIDAAAYGYDECIAWCMDEAARRKAAEDAVKAITN